MTSRWFESHPEAPSLRRKSDEGMTALDRLVLGIRSAPVVVGTRAECAADGSGFTVLPGSGDLEPTADGDGSTGPSESLGTGT